MAVGGGSWIRLTATEASLDANTIDRTIRQMLQRKAKSITTDPVLRGLVGVYYVNAVTPYVPKKSGTLRDSGRSTDDGRVYWTAVSPVRVSKAGNIYGGYNYAAVQYYTQFPHYTTPGTGPRWTDHVQPGTYAWQRLMERLEPEFARRL